MAPPTATESPSPPSYASVASHSPESSDNAVIEGSALDLQPDTTKPGLRRRGKGTTGGLGLDLQDDSTSQSNDDKDEEPHEQVDEKQEQPNGQNGKGKNGPSKGGSRIANAKRRVQEGLKSPLLGGIKLDKLDEIGERISQGVEIKFAPLNIPPHRRLQTFAVAFWALLIPFCLFSFFLLMSFPPMWAILIPYLIWIQFDQAPDRGGRPSRLARRFFLWKYFADHDAALWGASVIKEADLSPDRPYLFGYHPHGIIGMGAFATFATEGTSFSTLFPGIIPHLLTLESNFKIPFYRDVLLSLGICSVSKQSCRNILDQGPGNAITIVIGGAAESLSAHPGTADLTLKKRFGFVKIAIREGADLVPVFSFGENDIYDQLANKKGSWVYTLQKKFQSLFGFTLPLFYGRGIFNYNYGLMMKASKLMIQPFRHPIVSVVGKPIRVQRNPDPSDEKVHEVQQQYIDELMSIWDKYKDVYAKHRTKELQLVE